MHRGSSLTFDFTSLKSTSGRRRASSLTRMRVFQWRTSSRGVENPSAQMTNEESSRNLHFVSFSIMDGATVPMQD